MYNIDRNIPLSPVSRKRARSVNDFPFEHMQVGDSFFIPVPHEAIAIKRMYAKVHVNAKRVSISVAQRMVIENGKQGIRVWRLRKTRHMYGIENQSTNQQQPQEQPKVNKQPFVKYHSNSIAHQR